MCLPAVLRRLHSLRFAVLPRTMQTHALLALGKLTVLSPKVCVAHSDVTALCMASSGWRWKSAVVMWLYDRIRAFPTACASDVGLLGRLMMPAEVCPVAEGESMHTCTAVVSLLLSNKVRPEQLLGPAGDALVRGPDLVATTIKEALRRLFAGALSQDRAAHVMAILQRTAPENKVQAAEAVGGLLTPSAQSCDLLVSQCLQAALRPQDATGVAAAIALLGHLQPSVKSLGMLRSVLVSEASGTVLKEDLRSALHAFVQRSKVHAGEGTPSGSSPTKRPRTRARKPPTAAKVDVQQELRHMLARGRPIAQPTPPAVPPGNTTPCHGMGTRKRSLAPGPAA